ncbi:uncharacterized protein LOC130216576 [Danio aesculapii]|uniref:uncharacterized protein LOC130216576 n=1 Tax=Danio aesculapii TaxID=1142201 RepID=UPI0024BF4D4E|nr:uncharacterized protein LOC130216576 [Danio aesculapii]
MIYSEICDGLLTSGGVFADSGVVKSVMKGDSVTLESGVAELQPKDAVKWSFGNEKTNSIARINKEAKIFSTSDGDAVGFRDRLKLDHQTGSLTIMNTRTTDSGVYQITISGETTHTCTFNVTIYTYLPVPVITSNSSSSSSVQNCSVLCSVVNVNAVSLSWYKGNSLLSSISVSNVNNSLSLDLKCLDDSYSCVVNISNTKQTTHLTNTELCQPCPATTINSSQRPLLTTISSKSEHLNITELCQTQAVHASGCDSAEAVLRLVVTIVMGVAAAAAVVLLVNDIRYTRASMTKTGDLS